MLRCPIAPRVHLPQADHLSTEHQVVATVWVMIQDILCNGEVAAQEMIRSLTAVLPHPEAFSILDLPVLAKLHLSSAANLMGTLKLLAPAAFAPGSCQPDLSALDDADSGLLSMAATLIELQLFHLTRAAALTATSRKRLQRESAGNSSCKSSATNESEHMQFLDL